MSVRTLSAPALRRDAPAAPSVADMVAITRPTAPLHCLRPETLRRAAAEFTAGFPGTTMYAVKCNPDSAVLGALWQGGVRHFDCASIGEVRLVRGLFPDAVIHFMHPVKARPAIAEAYARHGVRDFVLDDAAELAKIVAETGGAGDLTLIVRIALPRGSAVCDLSGKFGAAHGEAVRLLRAARTVAPRIGVSFHVGSQCPDPLAWRAAIARAAAIIAEAGVQVDILDVGGGFPAAYADVTPPPLGAFFAEIEASVEAQGLGGLALWAEPGRALVASGTSVVVQVQLRRGDALHLNDGVFGSLADAGPAAGLRFPVRLLRASDAPDADFRFFGPTCDSADAMRGPFALPDDVAEGDWIEVGQTGAYGAALRTGFNGFDEAAVVEVRDLPLA